GPRRVGLEGSLLALVREDAVHRVAAYAGAEPPLPRRLMRLQLRLRRQHVVDAAGERASQLMTEVAVGLQRVDPMILRLHHRAEAVALGAAAGEFGFRRRLEQRAPVVAGIDFRR